MTAIRAIWSYIPPGPAPARRTRIDRHTLGAPEMTPRFPHGGEVHPDDDELLVVAPVRIESS